MKREEFGTLDTAKNDAVFVAFVTDITLPEMYKDDAGKTAKICMMQVRWDGRLGFAGGKVDEGETLAEAAVREVKEEIGENISQDDLTPVCSHSFLAGKRTMNTHLYMTEVSEEKMKSVISRSTDAEHFFSENCGNVVFHSMNYGRKGFEMFMKNKFASTVKEEIMVLTKEHLNPEIEFSDELLNSVSDESLYIAETV